jgi:hypothetical protein
VFNPEDPGEDRGRGRSTGRTCRTTGVTSDVAAADGACADSSGDSIIPVCRRLLVVADAVGVGLRRFARI